MALTYQDKTLTIKRPKVTIKGVYSPADNRWNRKATRAKFEVISVTPADAGWIRLSIAEWEELRRMYFENIKNG